MLATNPFTVECRPNSFCPETMFGIWRHSLGCPYGKDSFVHKFEFAETKPKHHEITWQHATYEAMAVSYADDITWSIENLNDANTAALLNGKKSIYDQLEAELSTDIPEGLMRAVAYGDAGALYTYFISDFNDNSERILAKLKDGCKHRQALREGARGAAIGLSESACEQLDLMKGFLNKTVFNELRVANRTKMLKTISEACMELLYRGVDDILPTFIKDKARIERWPETKLQNALVLLKDDVHRIQLAVDIFCEMSDQEIYDLVGIESL